jgi:uncharacterized protein
MASNPQHEPTMEEILASIRKIISEDSSEVLPAETKSETSGSHQADVSDVLELTREDVVEEPMPAAPVLMHQEEPAQVMPIAAPPRDEDDVVFQPTEEPPVSPSLNAAASNDAPTEVSEGFFSDTTRKVMHETFARLGSDHEEAPQALSADTPAPEGASVQAVFEHAVRESIGPVATGYLHAHTDDIVDRMKPIIREWMDEHFPAILEGAVRNEVERAVRAAAAAKPRR